VGRAESCPVVAVEVLAEHQVVPPGIRSTPPKQARLPSCATVKIDTSRSRRSATIMRSGSCLPDPVGYSTV
jgi:hypothetical protein